MKRSKKYWIFSIIQCLRNITRDTVKTNTISINLYHKVMCNRIINDMKSLTNVFIICDIYILSFTLIRYLIRNVIITQSKEAYTY